MEHYDLNLLKILAIIIIKFKIYFLKTIWLRMYWVHLGVPHVTLIS